MSKKSENKLILYKKSEYKINERYTELEKSEINKLSAKIKEVHTPKMNNIKPMTDSMAHLLNNDEELSSVYNKKTVLVGSLRKLVNKYEVDEKHEKYIDKLLFEEDVKKLKKPRACKETCIIF